MIRLSTASQTLMMMGAAALVLSLPLVVKRSIVAAWLGVALELGIVLLLADLKMGLRVWFLILPIFAFLRTLQLNELTQAMEEHLASAKRPAN